MKTGSGYACYRNGRAVNQGGLVMNIRLSVEKDKKVLSSGTYEVDNGNDWENACSDIWRRTTQQQPLNSLDAGEVLSGLNDLWGATMKLDRA